MVLDGPSSCCGKHPLTNMDMETSPPDCIEHTCLFFFFFFPGPMPSMLVSSECTQTSSFLAEGRDMPFRGQVDAASLLLLRCRCWTRSPKKNSAITGWSRVDRAARKDGLDRECKGFPVRSASETFWKTPLVSDPVSTGQYTPQKKLLVGVACPNVRQMGRHQRPPKGFTKETRVARGAGTAIAQRLQSVHLEAGFATKLDVK